MPSPIFQFNSEVNVFQAQFIGTDGEPVDITGDTPVDMEFRKPDNTKVIEVAVTIVDADNGIVEYSETTNAKTNIIGAWEYRPITASKREGAWLQFIVSD